MLLKVTHLYLEYFPGPRKIVQANDSQSQNIQ